jgi:hypothetical protein
MVCCKNKNYHNMHMKVIKHAEVKLGSYKLNLTHIWKTQGISPHVSLPNPLSLPNMDVLSLRKFASYNTAQFNVL